MPVTNLIFQASKNLPHTHASTHPELVRPLNEAGPGKGKTYRFKGYQEGWITAQRHWTQVTEDTGVGNPAKSTAEKGKAYLEMVTSKVGDFFVELAATGLEEMYA